MPTLKRSAFLSGFQCLGDACPDTCCKGWGMQIDPDTRAKYRREAPELLEAVTTGEAEWIMRRDPATDYCVKFDAGWCGIHRERGSAFLGDACHFFPRITRGLGETQIMTAALSCPEIARLALDEDAGFGYADAATDRLPYSLTDYLPEALDAAQALAVHTAVLEMAGDNAVSPERSMARIGSLARSLDMLDAASWPMAIGFYIRQVDGRLPAPEESAADPFNVLHALVGLLSAAKPSARPRLDQTIAAMEEALQVSVHRETRELTVGDASLRAYLALRGAWRDRWAIPLAPVLHRWIRAQLAAALFPFAGFGESISERAAILCVRFATVRLALMACCREHNGIPPQEEIIRCVQSISRFLDHLADPALSLALYRETGWLLEARARGLLEG